MTGVDLRTIQDLLVAVSCDGAVPNALGARAPGKRRICTPLAVVTSGRLVVGLIDDHAAGGWIVRTIAAISLWEGHTNGVFALRA